MKLLSRSILVGMTLTLLFTTGCDTQKNKRVPDSTATPAVTKNADHGQPSPKFNLNSPDGQSVVFDPTKNPDNEAFLLLFWSYRWDPNVTTFLARASELHERYAPRGLTVIGISYDEEPAGLRTFLAQNPLPFEVAVGTDSTYANFNIESIPTGILVDSSGKIAERWTGYHTTEELSETLTPYLPGRSGNSEP